MSPGLLQELNWAASGWVRRFVFVRLSYSCKAELKIGWRSEDEDDGERGYNDMMGTEY
jgi:hypothetical protein